MDVHVHDFLECPSPAHQWRQYPATLLSKTMVDVGPLISLWILMDLVGVALALLASLYYALLVKSLICPCSSNIIMRWKLSPQKLF